MKKNEIIEKDIFKDRLPEGVITICQTLKQNGFEAYLVGGAIRDILYFKDFDRLSELMEFDFATDATPKEVMQIFNRKKLFTVPTGLKHGTVTVVINGVNYEITTYRVDGKYSDGRRPDSISYSKSIYEDLSRRDFTINALAYDVIEKKLLDPFNGLSDLKKKIIRTVGNPVERFSEDGLRPVRACRFSAYLNFKIEKETFEAISATLDIIQKVSTERIRDEFFKLMKSDKPSIGIENIRKSGILNIFIPELLEGFEVEQNEFHRYDVYTHNILACDYASKEFPLVRFAALLHDLGKPRSKDFALKQGNGNVFYNHEIIGAKMAWKILKRLKFSNHDREYVLRLIRMHMFYYTDDWTDGAVRRFLRKIDGDMEFLEALFELRKADRVASGMKKGEGAVLERFKKRIEKIIEQDNAFKVTDLDINGNIIMEHFSLKAGPVIGQILEFMLETVIDYPKLNNREDLLKIGEKFVSENKNKLTKKKNNDILSVEK